MKSFLRLSVYYDILQHNNDYIYHFFGMVSSVVIFQKFSLAHFIESKNFNRLYVVQDYFYEICVNVTIDCIFRHKIILIFYLHNYLCIIIFHMIAFTLYITELLQLLSTCLSQHVTDTEIRRLC